MMMLLQDLFEKKLGATSATAWVILYTPNRVILGKRSPSVNNPNQWNFFGGHVDPTERPVDTATRELEEETGYAIDPNNLREISKIGSATYFTARITDQSVVGPTSEISRIKGFKLTDLPDNLHAKTETFFNQLDSLFSKQ